MITKYQAMMATLPVRSVSCEVQAVEDRTRTLRNTMQMLEKAGMLTHAEYVALAKPLCGLEDQVYELLCAVNEVEAELVMYAHKVQEHARKFPPSVDDLAEWVKQNPHFFGE